MPQWSRPQEAKKAVSVWPATVQARAEQAETEHNLFYYPYASFTNAQRPLLKVAVLCFAKKSSVIRAFSAM